MNFFFPGLNPEQLLKLQEANVPSCPFDIDGLSGTVIEEALLPTAIAALGLEVVGEMPTPYQGIVSVSFKAVAADSPPAREREPETPAVQVVQWDRAGYNDPYRMIRAVEEILLPAVQRDVRLSYVYRRPRRTVLPGPPDSLALHLGEGEEAGQYTPEVILGIPIGPYVALQPEGEGRLLSDDGFPYAQIDGNQVWVLLTLGQTCNGHEVALFRNILEEVAAELTLSPEEKAERNRQRAAEKRRRSREAYVAACAARLEKAERSTREAITAGKTQINGLQNELLRRIREVRGLERKLPQLQAAQETDLEKYGREFDKLLAVPKVREVEVEGSVVKVFTETLCCIDPRSGLRHEIGRFRIEIHTDRPEVRWQNLTRRVEAYQGGSMHAPHVFFDGSACLGNAQEIFPDLIANYEFAAAALVAIQFVESVNVGDPAGAYINRWPVAA